ncbi:Frequency clock protein [Teratosphaeria destructans]|uniref:Frequency clock protein n=1 Tax=Teratosphaeria destructans TaxID=418781 RepID=A0A9W7VXH0_9PEZI|nr:Frequency clock protein [Teratosphaeria destructans]
MAANLRQPPTITMTPPAHPKAAHPRRPPANRSVSLLHSPKRKSQSLSSSDSEKDRSASHEDSPSSLQPLGRDSSGESSNVQDWFEQSNNDVRDSTQFADNEPPFFMRNSSSSETPPEQQTALKQYLNTNDRSNSLPLRTGMLHLGTDGSSTDDYRGVIDDLTIANKKLKRRLKRYEKLHDSHLKDEKLFEVRVHGLPSDKKRELEEMLRKFAASLGTPDGSEFPANGYEGLMPLLKHHQTGGSQATDSAYASMSASGQGSAGVAGSDSRSRSFNPTKASMRQNIHSYLHHIPEGLLPQQNPANMSERQKKRLVARRLEQIFSGKGAAAGGHQQPVQQQEISQMAASADRTALEASGQQARLEGAREAQIMRQDDSRHGSGSEAEASSGSKLPAKTCAQNFAASSDQQHSNEQRPTRPLDLDPHRESVPLDNIRYMRHLGFSPPDPEENPEEGHGWIYLNLLVGMAQLHTINVTPDFVRKAVTEYSDKFELSPDGRKIRWRGHGAQANDTSGDHSGEHENSDGTTDGQSPRKRPKLTHSNASGSSVRGLPAMADAASQRHRVENQRLVYTPMFSHKDSTDTADDSSSEDDDDNSSPFPLNAAGESSGMTSSGVRTQSLKKPKKNKDDGPIIFYTNTRFCTDLSGERKLMGNVNAPSYTKSITQPIGVVNEDGGRSSETRGPLGHGGDLPEAMDLIDNPIPESMELNFPQASPLKTPSNSSNSPVDLDASGIGGVWPADNFSITVDNSYARLDQSTRSVAVSRGAKALPPKLARILRGHEGDKAQPDVHKATILSARRKDLPPSELPPALSFMPSSDESLEDEDSDEDDVDGRSISPPSAGGLPPSAAPQAITLPYLNSEQGDEVYEDEGGDDDDDGISESSVDFLAAAREVDPESIRAKEREYDAIAAERLAEEIPAGSSAATAGGGSGFASPASGVAQQEYQKAKRQVRAATHASAGAGKLVSTKCPPAGLKRARSGDSMQVQGLEDSGSESDEEDEGGDDQMSVGS